MTLVSVYYIGQTIAVLAIIISLIFVGVQVRQSTEQTKLVEEQTRQANSLAKADMSLTSWSLGLDRQCKMYATKEQADFMARALLTTDELTSGEDLRFRLNISSLLSTTEAAHVLYKRDLLEEDLYQRGISAAAYYFQSARVRDWWTTSGKNYFITSFGDVLDGICSKAASNIEVQVSERSDLESSNQIE